MSGAGAVAVHRLEGLPEPALHHKALAAAGAAVVSAVVVNPLDIVKARCSRALLRSASIASSRTFPCRVPSRRSASLSAADPPAQTRQQAGAAAAAAAALRRAALAPR